MRTIASPTSPGRTDFAAVDVDTIPPPSDNHDLLDLPRSFGLLIDFDQSRRQLAPSFAGAGADGRRLLASLTIRLKPMRRSDAALALYDNSAPAAPARRRKAPEFRPFPAPDAFDAPGRRRITLRHFDGATKCRAPARRR
jgi:hypothetical protein